MVSIPTLSLAKLPQRIEVILLQRKTVSAPLPPLSQQSFNERAAEAEANRGSIDFTKQVEIARAILAEAEF